jgi:hypothetical protein
LEELSSTQLTIILFSCRILIDCEASGDHPPEECKRSGAEDSGNTGSDGPCLAKHCAKECKDAGGDEVFAYAKYKWWGYFDYYNYICCKSKNEEQAKETESKKYSVKTILDPQVNA